MIGKLLQSAVCLCLSPLLVAQQVSQEVPQQPAPQADAATASAQAPPAIPDAVTIPKGTTIELVALDSVSSAAASVGSAVRYAVARDVAVDGVTVIRAGTPLTGIVTKARKGSTHHQAGELEIGVRELSIGKTLSLRLTDKAPPDPSAPKYEDKEKGSDVVKYALFVILLAPVWIPLLALGCSVTAPFLIAEIIYERRQESASPHWTDVTLQPCSSKTVYVASAKTIDTSQLAALPGSPATSSESPCPLTGTSVYVIPLLR